MATPRIVTLTVSRLRAHARWLVEKGYGSIALDVRDWSDELDAQDARETKLDPSKKPKRKAVK